MKKRLLLAILALSLCVGLAVPAFAANTGNAPNSNQTTDAATQQIFQAMVALEAQYPSWSLWTDDNYYRWKGGIFPGGYGCLGFAFMLSDAAFGDLPARRVTSFAFSDVRVGDILRIYNNTHSVIVLEVHDDYVVTAEGNVAGFVFWGNTLPAETVLSADYLLTRYPVNGSVSIPASTPAPAFADVPAGQFYTDAVAWAVENEITNGATATTFAPGQDCTQAQILTFLYRAAQGEGHTATAADMDAAVVWAKEKGIIDSAFTGSTPCTRATAVSYIWQALGRESAKAGGFTDIPTSAAYAKAVDWAVANGITNGDGSETIFSPNKVCTRGQIVTFLHRAYVPEARLTAG